MLQETHALKEAVGRVKPSTNRASVSRRSLFSCATQEPLPPPPQSVTPHPLPEVKQRLALEEGEQEGYWTET